MTLPALIYPRPTSGLEALNAERMERLREIVARDEKELTPVLHAEGWLEGFQVDGGHAYDLMRGGEVRGHRGPRE